MTEPAGKHHPPLIRGIRYGEADDQVGDLYLPPITNAPVVCLYHGGFWRMPYGREQWQAVADGLVSRGFAVWNIGYRRVGAGGGWPMTQIDAVLGLDHLATLVSQGRDLDLQRVALVGHSAGGQLALAASARHAAFPAARVRPLAVVGLAPVGDLEAACRLDLGRGAAAAFLGGTPDTHPERYAQSSPCRLLPLGVRQVLIHGSADAVVPIHLTQRFADTAREAGDDVELIELPGLDHMAFLDPASVAHRALVHHLQAMLRPVVA